MNRPLALTLPAVLALALAACGTDGDTAGGAELRLGYFPNLTHAPAIVGVQEGIFADALGDVALSPTTFNAGPATVEALFAGAIDAAYIGPNPTINAFAQSDGSAVRVIAGTTSGGAALVVNPSITSVEELRGKTIATPQLGNTQDVALRFWLAANGLETNTEGGGDVNIVPQDNSQTVQTFATGDIDGAWVPEPFVTRLQRESDGVILVDEQELWPDGEFVTTHLILRTEYLEENPEAITALLEAHVEALDFVAANPEDAQRITNEGIEAVTGQRIDPDVLAQAWGNLTFTFDPIAPSLLESAGHAESVGLLDPVDLDGLYELGPLNDVLEAAGVRQVSGP
ncbi:aliphatic sulfonate ABC transporter substrate-binding protein [soil metagenome]